LDVRYGDGRKLLVRHILRVVILPVDENVLAGSCAVVVHSRFFGACERAPLHRHNELAIASCDVEHIAMARGVGGFC
jgi:hypothetical protein